MSVDPAAEEQFGPYTVYERLGVGGMATVHRALEQGGERMVALKRLLPHLAEDASFIKSFVREAKLASILNHVNIVQIYELGRVGTEYFISMEYIDGRDVRRILRHARKVTGPPPIYVTIGLMIQLCEALDYAHNKMDDEGHPLGLVHRDISPSNLIVTSQGHLKIIDFGIAKAQSSQLRTQTGRVKGKLAYMAPEAISGSRDLDARSDIWATGVILHELITARPLFASKNEYQTLLKVQKGDILPPSTFNQACPPELDAIVFKALARDAKDRYANAAALREDLVELKKQYALQTGYRELASWVDWAFGLEMPPGFTGDTSGVLAVGNTSRVNHSKTPRPPRDEDEDEAVEVVWGSGNNESEDGPIVLEEVPDVSDKHRARRDTEDEALQIDDIPTPLPTHGTLPSIYGSNPEVRVVPPTRDRLPPHTIEPVLARARPRSGSMPVVPSPGKPGAAAAVIPPIHKPITGVQAVVPSPRKPPTGVHPAVARPGQTMQPATEPRAHRPTNPGIAPQQRQSDRMPATAPRSSDQMAVPRSSDRMPASAPVRVDAPQLGDRMAAQRARDSVAPPMEPGRLREFARGDSSANTHSESNAFSEDPATNAYRSNERDTSETPPLERASLSEEELFGQDAVEVLRGVSAQMEAQMEAMVTRTSMQRAAEHEPLTTQPEMRPLASLPSVPVVRFSKSHSIPPVNESNLGPAIADPNRAVPQTKPGVAPATPLMLPRTGANRAPASQSVAPANVPIAPKGRRMWLYVVVGILLMGGTATLVALSLGGEQPDVAQTATTAQPAPGLQPQAPVKAVGTVKFVLVPADAEIKVEGQMVHAGSPWTNELAAGIHQIEIHKQGYKSWRTSLELSANETHSMHVVLEPITNDATDDATLTIATTPTGLDVSIDGVPFADKTPIKTMLKVGSHKISVTQNGVEVWQQTVNAEASSDYEFNPSFTDAKKRERAQRTAKPAAPAPAPAPVPAPTSAGSGDAVVEAGSADAPTEEPKPEPKPEPKLDTVPNRGGGAAPITTPL